MFFSVATESQSNFPCHYEFWSWKFDCDQGWTVLQETDRAVAFKGYSTDKSADWLINNYPWGSESVFGGNFCVIQFTQDSVQLGHSQNRTFPLWISDSALTNFNAVGLQLWSDARIAIRAPWILYSTEATPDWNIESTTVEQATAKIIKLLVDQTQKFVANNTVDNLKVFTSGGLDTTLIHALLKHCQVPFTAIDHAHFEPDQFADDLQKFWGYKQIHHWNHPTWLATGSCGDEYFLRGPLEIGMITAWHNIEFMPLVASRPDAYHWHYFSRDKNATTFQQQWNQREQLREKYPRFADLACHLLDMNRNDHQHWHLGHTLTWTPLQELDVTRILLGVEMSPALLEHFLNGSIVRDCIEQLDPASLQLLDQYKNKN